MSESLYIHNVGTLYEPTGYAKANRQLVLELAKKGVHVRFTPIHAEQVRVPLDPNVEAILGTLTHTPLPPRHPMLFHYPAYHFVKSSVQYTIGMTMFECNRLPFNWARRCNMMDEIWVPSTFNRTSFAQSGIPLHKIHTMPYGVDSVLFQPRPSTIPIPGRRQYAFLAVCSFDERKGIETLVSAFFEEFDESEDVCLILKTRASSEQEILQQQHYIDRISVQVSDKPRPSVILLSTTGSWSEEQLAALYNTADCYVLPTRGEGWSLTVMEAMASGLPVITTNWSAHLDFMNDSNGYLIQVQGFVASNPAYPRLYWAIPDRNHLRLLMRHVYTHPEEAAAKAELGRRILTEQYTWEQSATQMISRLQQLHNL
ncbi:glycosyltransferase family 4 protein [Paenibacillus sp. UMB4589-SE434]|uniref:glycosyltransferase family 4 protein n=1 Tax=Paenibacillus sp. UMB4589-SE434 TaxID=3046314 RepID=UPI00254DB78A|nr:glycosyltransferase family 4 protein [Paenibacillus sp. UMB4589-SE434]MDK8181193.1 glycosyltransferase family 4 protein [Paenibacillus sp. UMB4589-SE434]